MLTPFDRVRDALTQGGFQPRQVQGRTMARCPAHEDRNPSLSVREGAEGRVLLYCFAGCQNVDVVAALGLSMRDLFAESYCYDDGRTVSRSYDAQGRKQFRQSGNTQGRPSLYRLGEVRRAVAAGQVVHLAEGEKDADALAALGCVATTGPQGAGNFHLVDAEPLKGAQVVAVVDKDDAGTKWAVVVRDRLAKVGARVRFVQAAAGKDAADHIAAGHGVDDLEPWQPPNDVTSGNTQPEVESSRVLADQAGSDAHETGPASWAPVDLAPILDGTQDAVMPTLLPRADGVCLVYPGLTHSFHGESESGKSLVLQVEAVRLLTAGARVLFVDFESDAASVVGRLVEFGAAPEAVRAGFVYLRPEVRPDTARELHAFLDVLAGSFALAIVDGVTDSLGVFGYSTKDNDDVTAWSRELPRRIADRTGAAVVLVDHVTKDSESRGRFAIGGQAKLSGLTGAAYTVEVARPLGRGLRGVVVLRVGKDRPGFVRGHAGPMRASDRTQEVARVVVDSTGLAPVVTVESWKGHDSDPDAPARPWRPTAIMEALSRALEAAGEPLSFRTLDDLVRGKADHKRTALAELDAAGFVTITAGPRGARLHTGAKPYRQANDPASDVYEPRDTLDPLDRVPDPSDDCVPCPVPTPGDGTHTLKSSLTVSGTQSGHSRDTVTRSTEKNPTDLPQGALTYPGPRIDCPECDATRDHEHKTWCTRAFTDGGRRRA